MKRRVRADRAARSYRGTLAKPIQIAPPRVGILTSEAERRRAEAEYNAAISKAQEAKMPALYSHYSINPNTPWGGHHLAMCLAITHVQGFEIIGPPGRTPEIGPDLELCMRVLLWQAEHPGATDVAACQTLASSGKGPLAKMKWQTALRRYKAKKKLAIGLFGDWPAPLLRGGLARKT